MGSDNAQYIFRISGYFQPCRTEGWQYSETLPFSLHLTQTNINLYFFFGKQSFLHISFNTTEQERTQNLELKEQQQKEQLDSKRIYSVSKFNNE